MAADSLGIGTTVSSFPTSTTNTTTTVATEEIARVNFTFDDTYSFKLTDRETGLNYQIQPDNTSIATGSISAAADTLTQADHGLRTGDQIALSGNGSMTGTFYVIKVDEDTIQVATSKGNAINGTGADITAGATVALTPSGLTLNLEDSQSKADFVDRVNAGLKESAINTSVTGNASSDSASFVGANSAGVTTNLTTIDGDHFKFALTVDGETVEVDFLNRALAAASTDTGATMTEIVTGLRNQIQSDFDDSLTVTQSSGRFTIEDAQGRSLSVEQGAGTGYFFGTDSQNSGAILTSANTQNNLSVAFDGNDLVINHAAAGGVDLTNYTAAAATTYTQFTPTGNSTSSLTEPVILADNAVSTSITTTGNIGESKIAMNFSNVFGYAPDGQNGADSALSATYAFELTDGAGNIYASFTGGDILNVQKLNNSDAAIVSAVEAQIMAVAFADTTITDDEFEVAYSGGVLTISNKLGRDLAIENFSSDYGSVMVSKLDGLDGYETLSSKGALPSELRITRGFGTTLSATTAYYMLNVDGGSTSFTVDISEAFDALNLTGWTQATAIEAGFQATTGLGTDVRVAYDSSTDEFVINDLLGRQFHLNGFVANKSGVAQDAGQYVVQEDIVNAANKNNSVNTETDVTSGVITEATVVDLTFSQDTLTSTNFKLNGVTLAASTFNFDTTDFAGSTFQTNLNTMVSALNAVYNGSPISYSMNEDTRTLTFTHAKGGELVIDTMVSSNASLTMDAKVQAGIGTDTTISYFEALTSATIEGDGVVDGEASVVTTSSSSSSSTTNTTGIDQITVSTQSGANAALASIDAALTTVNGERSRLGALENRLDHTINNLSNIATNTSAAKSRILDADFAAETANLTKNQILSQAATSMLAQANQSKQSILVLL